MTDALISGLLTAVTAWQHHLDPARAAQAPALSGVPQAYAGLLGLTLLNPATVIYFAALVIGHRASSAATGAGAQVVFVVAAFAASASWQLFLAASGSALGRYLGGPRGRLATAVVSSLLIIVLAVKLLA